MLKNAHVLVTGGVGFIGSHIVDQLLNEEVKSIIVLDNFVRGNKTNLSAAMHDKRVKLIDGDIRDKVLVKTTIKGIDVIFHEAALRHTQCTADPRLGHEVLVDGTLNVFEAAAFHKIKKIVFASSASVYGNPKHLPMKETDPFNDNTIYGAAKIYNERLAIAFHKLYNLPFIGLRYFNVYGPRMDTHGVYTEVLIRWLQQIKKGSQPVVFGDGKNSMDFVYVKDVARANIIAAKSNIDDGIFNVGSGKQTTLRELLSLMCALTKSDIKPIFKPALQHGLANRRQADIRHAAKTLGFVVKTPLKEGLQKFIDWYNSSEDF